MLLPPTAVEAQLETAPPPAAWALDDVTLVRADGTTEEGMTLVVRDGLIETLAPGAPVPADARRITWEAGTLRVYPGIVDAHGNASTSFPVPDREGVEPWSPTREVQFFTPHRVTAQYLTATGGDLGAHRRRGIVASTVFPGRGIMPGQPSLILHRADARTPRELVLRPTLGVAMAFQGAQGAYPGTLMAQHAFIRQAFADAAHHRARGEAYRSDPRGLTTDTWDADLEMVQRMASGEVPVWFRADGAEEIRRVFALADELGFSPVIVGGAEAGRVAAELRERGVPVLLNSRMPRPMDWDPEADDEEDELSPAAFRERQRLEPVYRTPAALAEHGVPFAFTSGGEGAVDLIEGVRRAIDFDLEPDAALRALTSWPADFLGVPEIVRLEEGSAATFMVTDGPLFEEGRSVTWTFVNGIAEKGADPRTPAAAAEADAESISPSELAGRWEGQMNAMGQEIPMQLDLEVDGDELQGTVSGGPGGTRALQDVRIEGATLQFSVAVPEVGGARSTYTATIEDDRMTGSGEIGTPQGSFNFNFELRRVPGGDHR